MKLNNQDLKEKIKIALGLFSFASVWYLLIYQLFIFWETNEQYSHGFLVPFLCIFLFLKTDPLEVNAGNFYEKNKTIVCFIAGIPLLISLFPLWLIRSANSDWRLINLALYSVVLILSLLHLSFFSNRKSSLKSFLFPLLFFLLRFRGL